MKNRDIDLTAENQPLYAASVGGSQIQLNIRMGLAETR
jgi:hypothetical protein